MPLEPGDASVVLRMGTEEIKISSSYTVRQSVFDQPANFSCMLGDGSSVVDLAATFPPNTPFTILIEGNQKFSGFTDGYSHATGDASSGTQVEFFGRDVLAFFHDGWVEKDESFNGHTYRKLIEHAIEISGMLKPFAGLGTPAILTTNTTNRSTVSGQTSGVVITTPAASVIDSPAGTRGEAFQVIRTRAGERVLELLRRHLESVGLFLWATSQGDIIVGRPDGNQEPIYSIVRRRGDKRSNVLGGSLKIDWSKRNTEVVVFGRHGSRKKGRQQVKSGFEDENFRALLGYDRALVITNANVTSIAHAQHVAQVKLAAGRREGFKLSYTMAGHTTPGANGKDLVWSPDTVVFVDDEEFGLRAPFYISDVEYSRSDRTRTTVQLMRPNDLVFGEGDAA